MYEKNSSEAHYHAVFWRKEFFFKKKPKTHTSYREKLLPLSTPRKTMRTKNNNLSTRKLLIIGIFIVVGVTFILKLFALQVDVIVCFW